MTQAPVCRVLLVDPTHTYQILANDCFPLGSGFIGAYVKARLGSQIDVRIEKYPDRALGALGQFRPQVLLLSNYLWNSDLSYLMAAAAKKNLPGVLVVQGGPNLPLEPGARQGYLTRHPEIDVYIVGEGEEAVAQLLEDFLASDGSVDGLIRDGRLASCVYVRDGQLVTRPLITRIEDLNSIPSPYLSGMMDPFFDDAIHPLIETNRGCPFTCTFCQQGTDYFTKVRNFDVERVKEELNYIARKIRERCPRVHVLEIADANFGMYERDLVIADHIGRIQAEFGWPTFIEATTGKNRSSRVLQAVELMKGGLTVLNAVQSMDETVLRHIKRSNIQLTAYAQIQEAIVRKGLQSKAEIILGLPGETLTSHLATIRQLMEAGIQRINTYQLMLLMGTELEVSVSRREFDVTSRWRVLPRSFGEYDGRKAFEIEEVCVSTNTLSFADYLRARRIHLLLNIFFNEWLYREMLEYMRACGISPFTWLLALDEGLVSAPPVVRHLFDDFIRETESELFPTEEAARTFYSDPGNFVALTAGEIGGNLLFKYWAKALFTCFGEITAYAFDRLRHLHSSIEHPVSGNAHEEMVELERFTHYRLVFGRVLARELGATDSLFGYDFARWIDEKFSQPLADYRRQARLRFHLSEARKRIILDNLDLWGASLVGLTKMMTRLFVADFRASVEEEAALDDRVAQGPHQAGAPDRRSQSNILR